MQPHEIHHIKAYIVFFLLSALLIGLLIYLYLPAGIGSSLGASVFGNKKPDTIETVLPVVIQPEVTSAPSRDIADDGISGRRIRLTQILIRTQKELQILENQRKSSPKGLDAAAEEKIVKLREKIATIEKLITEMK